MDCRQTRTMLGPYLEGFVSSEEKRLVEEHLASCTPCRDALADLQKTAGLLRNLEEVEPPPWFTQKVMARVKEQAEKKNAGILERLFVPLRVKVPLQALATALIVVLALYVYRSVEPEMKLAQAPPEATRAITKEEMREPHDRAGGSAAPKTQAVPEERHLKDGGSPIAASDAKGIGTTEKEGTVPPPSVEAERAERKKNEVAADRAERETKAAAPARGQEVVQSQKPFAPAPAPAGVSESAVSPPSSSARSRDTAEQKTLAPVPEARSLAAKEAVPLSFTLRVADVTAAAGDIERLLVRLGGRSITAQSSEDKTFIGAEFPARRIDELVRSLSSFGQVGEKGSRVAGPDATLPIRIEISARP